MIYDKLKETALKTISKKRLADKLIENAFCLRFEIDVKSKSGLKIKKELSSFMATKDNWNIIIDYLIEQFFLIEIVDDFSRIKEIESNDLNLTQLKNLFIFLMIDNLGIEEVYKIINVYSGRKKSEYRRKFREIQREFLSINRVCKKTIVRKKVRETGLELKK